MGDDYLLMFSAYGILVTKGAGVYDPVAYPTPKKAVKKGVTCNVECVIS